MRSTTSWGRFCVTKVGLDGQAPCSRLGMQVCARGLRSFSKHGARERLHERHAQTGGSVPPAAEPWGRPGAGNGGREGATVGIGGRGACSRACSGRAPLQPSVPACAHRTCLCVCACVSGRRRPNRERTPNPGHPPAHSNMLGARLCGGLPPTRRVPAPARAAPHASFFRVAWHAAEPSSTGRVLQRARAVHRVLRCGRGARAGCFGPPRRRPQCGRARRRPQHVGRRHAVATVP